MGERAGGGMVGVGFFCGGVAEWLKAHAWKACRGVILSRVRIPLPPFYLCVYFFTLPALVLRYHFGRHCEQCERWQIFNLRGCGGRVPHESYTQWRASARLYKLGLFRDNRAERESIILLATMRFSASFLLKSASLIAILH